MRKVIVNTTPIIALADIGHLDLLQKLYTEIIIPEAVHAEILSEPARSQVSAVDWIKVQKVANANTKSNTKDGAASADSASAAPLYLKCPPRAIQTWILK